MAAAIWRVGETRIAAERYRLRPRHDLPWDGPPQSADRTSGADEGGFCLNHPDIPDLEDMDMSLLPASRFSPSRGGHAPGDVRDAFIEAIEAYRAWKPGEPEPEVELRDELVPISSICRLLWNCDDVLASQDVYRFELACGVAP